MALDRSKGFVALVYKWHKLPPQQATGNEIALWDSLQGSDRCALSVDKEASGSIKGHYRDVPTGTCDKRCGWRYIWALGAVFFTSVVRGFTPHEHRRACTTEAEAEDTELKRNHDLCHADGFPGDLPRSTISADVILIRTTLSLSLFVLHTHISNYPAPVLIRA